MHALHIASGRASRRRRAHHDGELTLDGCARQIVEVLTLLRDDADCQFEVLIDICGVDCPAREKRFDVVYHLLSPRLNQRVRVKDHDRRDDARCRASNGVFPAANWYEREAYDMYGILFYRTPGSSPHPDRLRLPGLSAAQGFPLTGYVEVRYDDEKKRVVYEPVKLTRNSASLISKARGKARTTCFRGTRKLAARNANRALLIDDLYVRDLSKAKIGS